MAAPTNVDICNLALARIGQNKQITAIDGSDTSALAARCALMYPAALRKLLQKHRWSFATRVAVLAPDTSTYGDAASNLSGWLHAYLEPADLIEPQYIYMGLRPAASAVPWALGPYPGAGFLGFPFPGGLSILGGQILNAPFEHAAQHINTDWADTPTVWDATITYAKNMVVAVGATNYASVTNGNVNHDPASDNGTNWIQVTDPSSAVLIYTADVEDASVFPPLFGEALAWKLAVDLSLSLATKDQKALAVDQKADLALADAMAAEGNARQPDPIPASKYVAVRY